MFPFDTIGPVAKDQWAYRQRSDDPDLLHYVTARGIEGIELFKDDTDRKKPDVSDRKSDVSKRPGIE